MSKPQPGGGAKKGGGKGPPKDRNQEDAKEPKDAAKEKSPSKDNGETGSTPDSEETPTPKPQSAGASNKDAAQRVLTLCQKGEWAPIDQILKGMEKAIAAAGEDANTVPLAGVLDIVSVRSDELQYVRNVRGR